MNTEKNPFFLSVVGITVISLATCGLALPFLLWARGPKTKDYRNKLVGWSIAGFIAMGIVGAFVPGETPIENGTDVTSTSVKKVETTITTPIATATEDTVRLSNGSLNDLEVSSNRYLYKDCNQIDWCWQPKGTYTNTSSSQTITYMEVVYVIQAGGAEIKHVDRMLKTLKPGRSTPIMSGEYNYSFRLEFYDDQAKVIGPLLGSTYVNYWAEVRHLRFSDGTSVGTRVG